MRDDEIGQALEYLGRYESALASTEKDMAKRTIEGLAVVLPGAVAGSEFVICGLIGEPTAVTWRAERFLGEPSGVSRRVCVVITRRLTAVGSPVQWSSCQETLNVRLFPFYARCDSPRSAAAVGQ